jgi:hypothetical protein
MKRSALFLAAVLASLSPRLALADALYVADAGDGTVLRVDPRTGGATTVASNLSEPSGLAFGSDNALYVAVSGEGVIRRLSSSNGASTIVASGLDHPRRLAADAHGGLYFVTGPLGSGVLRSQILHVYLGQQPTLFSSVEADVTGLAVGPDGRLFVAETVSAGMARPGSNLMVMIPQGRRFLMTHGGVAGRAAPIAVDNAGNVLVGTGTGISKVAFETLLPFPGAAGQGAMIDLVDLATDRVGEVFALSQDARTVFLIRPDGTVQPLKNGLKRPTAIAFGPDLPYGSQPVLQQPAPQPGTQRPSPWSAPAPQPSPGPGQASPWDSGPSPQQQPAAQPRSGALKQQIPVRIHIEGLAVAPDGTILAINPTSVDRGLFRLADDGTMTLIDLFPEVRQWKPVIVAIGFGPLGTYALDQRQLWLIRRDAAPSQAPRQFQFASGLAVCPDGNAYVADTLAKAVYRYGNDGSVGVFAFGLAQPKLMACGADNSLYVTVTPAGSFLTNTAILRSTNGSEFQPFASGLATIGALTFTPENKLLASVVDSSTPDGRGSDSTRARYSLVGFDQSGKIDWSMPDVDGSGGLVMTPRRVIYAAPRWATSDHYYAVTRISWPN